MDEQRGTFQALLHTLSSRSEVDSVHPGLIFKLPKVFKMVEAMHLLSEVDMKSMCARICHWIRMLQFAIRSSLDGQQLPFPSNWNLSTFTVRV